jgi:hypothetical protein
MAGPGRNVSRYLLPARQQVGKLGNFCKMRALADLADRWFSAFAKMIAQMGMQRMFFLHISTAVRFHQQYLVARVRHLCSGATNGNKGAKGQR